jgi:hypothetical protein
MHQQGSKRHHDGDDGNDSNYANDGSARQPARPDARP